MSGGNGKLGASYKSSDHFRLGRGVRSIKANLESRTIVRKIVAVLPVSAAANADKKETKRAADLLVELKSSLKRDLEARVNDANAVGE